MIRLKKSRTLLLCLLAAMPVAATAQRGGGHMGGSGVRMGGVPVGPRSIPGGGMPTHNAERGGEGMRGGRSAVPVGRWWDDKKFARSLGLKGDQQKRMDRVFTQNRDVLQQKYDAFTKEKNNLDSMKRNTSTPENDLFGQIQRTSQARAELEQAYTHMQLQIRGELTQDQLNKLEEKP